MDNIEVPRQEQPTQAFPQITVRPPEPNVPDVQKPVSLATPQLPGPIISPEVAANRAAKATAGLGFIGVNYDDTESSILSGREKEVRERAASQLTRMESEAGTRFIQEMIATKGGPLDSNDINYISAVATRQGVDADSVFEQYYGRVMMDEVKRSRVAMPDNVVDQAEAEAPTVIRHFENITDTLLSKNLYAQTVAENLKGVVDKQSTVGYLADLGKNIFPFYKDLKVRGTIPGTGFFEGGLQGGNLEAQRKRLSDPSLSFKEYKRILDSVVAALAKDNPSLAHEFAMAMVGQTVSEENMNDAFNYVDLLTAPGLKGLKNVAGRAIFGKSKESYKELVRAAAATSATRPSEVIEATGNLTDAAVTRAAESLVAGIKGGDNTVTKEALRELPRAMTVNAESVKRNVGSFTREWAARISERTIAVRDSLIEAVLTKANVERIPIIEAGKAFTRAIMNDIRKDYPGLRNNILDIDTLIKEPITNTWHVEVRFGDAKLGQWTEEQTAHNWAKHNGILDYRVEQKGIGFHVVTTKPIAETGDIVRDSLIKTGLTMAPEAGPVAKLIGAPLRALRSAEDTLSQAERQNRKVAADTRSVLMEVAKGEAKFIEDLVRGVAKDVDGSRIRFNGLNFKKQRYDDWTRVVESTKDIVDPANSKPGYFFQNIGELESHYLKVVGRKPDAVETEAYFAFKNLMEMDRFLRNMVVYRNKARLGVMQHQITVFDKVGAKVESPFFDAVKLRELIKGEGAILTVKRFGNREPELMEKIGTKRWDQMVENVKSGEATLLQLFDPDSKPLKGFFKGVGDRRIQYIYVEKGAVHGEKNLSFEQVPSRGGFHLEPEYDHYIKQAMVNMDNFGGKLKAWYQGDRTVMPVAIRAMGEDLAEKMNAVRLLIKEKKIDEAKDLAIRTLPFEFKEFYARFQRQRVNGIWEHPEFNINEPFQVVGKDTKIVDQGKALADRWNPIDPKTGQKLELFVDGTRNGSLAKQYQVPFTGEKNAESLQTVINKGTPDKPVYEMANAKFIDPSISINRALSKVANSVFMDDYKMFAMEHWLERAKQYLKADDHEIRSAPFYHFSHGGHKESFHPETPIDIRMSLQQDWQRIRQFVGVKDDVSRYLESKAQDLADTLYLKTGKENSSLVSSHMLPFVKDAPAYLRSMAFHLSMGLWSVPQLLTQLSTYSTIMGVAGWHHASSGTMAAMLTAWGRINKDPAILKALDKKMTEMRIPGAAHWKPGEFSESIELLNRSGFGHIAGEHAMLDYNALPTMIKGRWAGMLDSGKLFFNMGERGSRYGAWHTAYREFRDANPTVKIGNKELQTILDRADLLNVNMTSASQSVLNKGFFSLPMQFLTYQVRLAELFFSKRIGETTAERNVVRARMMAWNMAIYGAPASIGVTGLPISDSIRQAAIDRGYAPGNAYWSSLLTEGLLPTTIALATGFGDIKKGNFYNIGDKFGQNGFTPLKEILSGDKGWFSLLGAAPEKLYNIITSTDDYWKFAGSFIRQDPYLFKPNIESVMQIIRNVSSANHTEQWLRATFTGNWLSKSGALMGDNISPSSALGMYLTGVTTQGMSDTRNLSKLKEAREKMQEKGMKNALNEYRIGTRNLSDNPSAALTHFNNAMAELHMGGFPQEKLSTFFAIANKSPETVKDSLEWSYFIRNVDPRVKQRSFETYGNNSKAPQ